MAKAPAPPADDEDGEIAAPAADEGDTDEGAGDETGAGAGPTVLLTVMDDGDGTFTLYQGDEPEGGEAAGGAEGGGEEGAEGAEEPAEGADEGEGGMGAGTGGKQYDSVGALMKGIFDVLNNAAASSGDAQSNFEAGFSGSSAPTPKMPAAAQKY
jgi:hypothetical protein